MYPPSQTSLAVFVLESRHRIQKLILLLGIRGANVFLKTIMSFFYYPPDNQPLEIEPNSTSTTHLITGLVYTTALLKKAKFFSRLLLIG